MQEIYLPGPATAINSKVPGDLYVVAIGVGRLANASRDRFPTGCMRYAVRLVALRELRICLRRIDATPLAPEQARDVIDYACAMLERAPPSAVGPGDTEKAWLAAEAIPWRKRVAAYAFSDVPRRVEGPLCARTTLGSRTVDAVRLLRILNRDI